MFVDLGGQYLPFPGLVTFGQGLGGLSLGRENRIKEVDVERFHYT